MSVKDIIVRVIPSQTANPFVIKHHYSGKVCNNSQVHFGCFLNDELHGVMSFGASMDKNRMMGLVEGTKFNEFLELNRMAFDGFLPKNSESRCIAVAMKLIKKNAPHIKWVVSFADGCQCGDGTIYRASGFVLVQINKNQQIMRMPDGRIIARKSLDNEVVEGKYGSSYAKKKGAKPIDGFMLKYVYFIDKSYRSKLTVPELPFSKIAEIGAKMYKGKSMRTEHESNAPGCPPGEGGPVPTCTLQN